MALLYVRRIVEVVVTLLLVTFFTFMMLNLLPGNLAVEICGVGASPSCVHQVTIQDGLDHPLLYQYWIWVRHLLSGNLGVSYYLHTNISTLLAEKWAVTVELVLYSQIMAVALAVPLAMWAALRPNRMFDRISTSITFATLSLPPFITGPVLVLAFAVSLHAFPGPATAIPSIAASPGTNLYDYFLPSMALAIGSIAVYQRLLRADMISTLEEDFIVMARAKGLSTTRILFRHALRPSTFTVMTVGGVQVGSLIAGAIIVEQVFAMNGLGSLLTNGVQSKDYPVVQIVTVIVAVAYIVINLFIDFLYAVVDPRTRRARAS